MGRTLSTSPNLSLLQLEQRCETGRAATQAAALTGAGKTKDGQFGASYNEQSSEG